MDTKRKGAKRKASILSELQRNLELARRDGGDISDILDLERTIRAMESAAEREGSVGMSSLKSPAPGSMTSTPSTTQVASSANETRIFRAWTKYDDKLLRQMEMQHIVAKVKESGGDPFNLGARIRALRAQRDEGVRSISETGGDIMEEEYVSSGFEGPRRDPNKFQEPRTTQSQVKRNEGFHMRELLSRRGVHK
jgi:hypothetical protein